MKKVQRHATYDSLGRMLTRTDGDGTTTFEWDGWCVVREIAPDDTITRYYCPQGGLFSFERGRVTYQVICDALGSVRLIVDEDGDVVSHFEYDAWGNLLPSTEDEVPGGFQYRFVGALGVRIDIVTGLTYMRQRWYDSALQRFTSREPLGIHEAGGLYGYALNQPQLYSDPLGLYSTEQVMNVLRGINACKGLTCWADQQQNLEVVSYNSNIGRKLAAKTGVDVANSGAFTVTQAQFPELHLKKDYVVLIQGQDPGPGPSYSGGPGPGQYYDDPLHAAPGLAHELVHARRLSSGRKYETYQQRFWEETAAQKCQFAITYAIRKQSPTTATSYSYVQRFGNTDIDLSTIFTFDNAGNVIFRDRGAYQRWIDIHKQPPYNFPQGTYR